MSDQSITFTINDNDSYELELQYDDFDRFSAMLFSLLASDKGRILFCDIIKETIENTEAPKEHADVIEMIRNHIKKEDSPVMKPSEFK